MRVSVLGLGRMGVAVATRLLDKGYEVTVWNRTPGRDASLTSRGAASASSVAEAAASADVVITLLTDDAAVESVALGEQGAIAHLGDGAALVDMSTVSPVTSRKLGDATPQGRFVEAPIMGGPEITAKGQATLLLGGNETVVRDLDALLSDLSSRFIYCGPNGSATTMKLLSNLNLIGGTILLAEAVTTAQANGIGDDVLRQVLGQSPAVAPGVRLRLEDILSGDHQGWWTIRLAQKDMRLALQLASSMGLALPLGSESQDVLAETEATGYGEKDLAAVVEAIRGQRTVEHRVGS